LRQRARDRPALTFPELFGCHLPCRGRAAVVQQHDQAVEARGRHVLCVCVRERERETERQGQRETERDRETERGL
jgi:hypothetical protein